MDEPRLWIEPADRLYVAMSWNALYGWQVAVSFARPGEGWNSPPERRYDALTLGEALDVVDCEVESLRGF